MICDLSKFLRSNLDKVLSIFDSLCMTVHGAYMTICGWGNSILLDKPILFSNFA